MKGIPAFFSANCSVGCGARGEPELRTARDLLQHMDRLGVSRALVWSVAARDHHPATGNIRLLEEIEANDRAGMRLVPAFVVAPSMLYERSSAEELVGIVQAGRVRALRTFPGTLRHKLMHLEPLLEKLLPAQLPLFVDVRDAADAEDLLALARRFPRMPIICTDCMWPQVFNFSVLDLMRRQDNILIETSLLHSWGTIELVVREFGSHRLVLGSGQRSLNGASMAGLCYAGIGTAEREAIAHGNLERLLGLGPTARHNGRGAAGKSAAEWRRFLIGKPRVKGIVDAHGHLGAIGIWPVPEHDMAEQVRLALRRMDALGIETMIVSGMEALFSDPVEGNRKLQKAARGGKGRIRGYLAFNPFYANELARRLEQFFSGGFFVGFKILGGYWRVPVTDRRFEAAYEYANRHRLPILLHTWQGPYDSPAMLKDIARSYPDAVFLLGHSGGGNAGRREAEELARSNPNVFLEWCGSFTATTPWEDTIRRVESERVVFGTDAVFHDPAWELGRFLSLDVPFKKLRPILGCNMRRILMLRR